MKNYIKLKFPHLWTILVCKRDAVEVWSYDLRHNYQSSSVVEPIDLPVRSFRDHRGVVRGVAERAPFNIRMRAIAAKLGPYDYIKLVRLDSAFLDFPVVERLTGTRSQMKVSMCNGKTSLSI